MANSSEQVSSHLLSAKEYIIKQLIKIIILLIIICLLWICFQLSSQIPTDKPIGFDSQTYIFLIITSSILFILVVLAFTKIILFDNREEFGIVSYKSWRTFFFFLLMMAFLSAVYLLLDVALIKSNVYLIIGPVDVVWLLVTNLNISIANISSSTNFLAYSNIRNLYFLLFIVIMLLFPLFMFLMILTRLGRKQFFKVSTENTQGASLKSQLFRLLSFIFIPIIELFFLVLLFSGSSLSMYFDIFIGLLGIIFAIYWLYLLTRLIWKTVKITIWFSYANILLVFPIIFVFYILPVVLWSSWDILLIYTQQNVTNTIHSLLPMSTYYNATFNFSTFTLVDHLTLVLKTLLYNALPFPQTIIRILQLDFVIIVGISAIVIGIAEGYSLLAIFQAMYKGISISRTNHELKYVSPKFITTFSKLAMFGAWLSLLWDKFLIIYAFIKLEFPVFNLPKLSFTRIFSYVLNLGSFIESYSNILLPLAALLVPLYIIITSAFKFLSITIAVDKTKSDSQVLLLLVSSAFVLITTQILQDITTIYMENGYTLQYLPLSFAGSENLLPWASRVFENLEAFSFYIGVFVIIIVLINKYINKHKTKSTSIPQINLNSNISTGETANVSTIESTTNKNEIEDT